MRSEPHIDWMYFVGFSQISTLESACEDGLLTSSPHFWQPNWRHTSDFNPVLKATFGYIDMGGTTAKRQKRETYRAQHRADEDSTELPRKKFYRQRAHANPFSDHRLV